MVVPLDLEDVAAILTFLTSTENAPNFYPLSPETPTVTVEENSWKYHSL